MNNDLRVAWRTLLKSPSYAAIGILTLSLAIGGATTIFSVLNAVVLRPLPYPEPERLMVIRDAWPPRFPEFSVSPARFMEWQARTRAFESLAAFQNSTFNLTGSGEPMRVRGARVNFNMFPLLGVGPLKGRTFTAEEDRPNVPRVLVISEGLWRDRFGADEGVIGRGVTIDDQPWTIVGVMPRTFLFPNTSTQAWTPIGFTDDQRRQYGSHYISAMGRLKPGVTVEAAREDQLRASREIESINGNQGWTSLVIPYLEFQIRNVRAGVWVLSGAVGMVLLIACANLANLLLARGVGRQRELGVRAALGATRGRLVRQMLVENTLVAVLGSLGGIALAYAGLKILTSSPSTNLPRADAIALDLPTLGFAALLAGVTPLLFGLLPAVQMSRTDLRELMSQGGRSGSGGLRARTRALLIVAEVGLAVMLVVGSVLLMRSFERLVNVSPGFETSRQLVVGVSLPASRYKDDAQRDTFWRSLIAAMEAAPGVESAAVAQALPFVGDHVAGLSIPGKTSTDPQQQPSTNFYAVSPDYFKTMGIPILQGRGITAQDTASSARVAVISQTIATRFFGTESPLGHRLTYSQGPASNEPSEIVGVAGDVKQYGLDSTTTLQVYAPAPQHAYFGGLNMVVRSVSGPDAVTASVRGVLERIDPNLPVFTARSLSSIVDASVGPRRLTTTLLGLFAAMALLLAVIGAYGLVSFTVGQRTQEIGIRVALGSPRGRVIALVFRQGVGLALLGAVLGSIGAIWVAHLLSTEMFESSPRDAMVAFTLAPVVLVVAVGLACWIPARRATRVDPVTALRST
jgi:putative ABC transport system permease protein